MEKKSRADKNPLDPQTVFTIKTSELKKKTQCKEHEWKQISPNEIACDICGTVLIVKNIKDYV